MMFKDLLMALDVFWAGTLIIARHSEFCILINYPEICNAYGSLVHLQATKTPFIYMSGCMSVLRQHIFYFKLSLYFLFFYPMIFVFDLFFYHFMPSLSGKPYKMCRLKLMYNKWSSQLQVTDGGGVWVMDFKMSYCWYTEQDGYKHERRERWVRIHFWDECWPISRVPCLKVCFSFLFFVYGSHEAIRFMFLILACPTLSTDPTGKRERQRDTVRQGWFICSWPGVG